MIYLSYFIHAWLIFVTPLKYLHYKPTIKQRVLFTVIYGLGIGPARSIYKFLRVPFGIHTVFLLVLSTILFRIILKDFSWQNSIYVSLIIFIILLINDALILLPIMKLFNLTIGQVEESRILTFMMIFIVNNLLLILTYVASTIRNLMYDSKEFKQYL